MNFNKAVPFYLVSIDVYQISIMNTMQFVVFLYAQSSSSDYNFIDSESNHAVVSFHFTIYCTLYMLYRVSQQLFSISMFVYEDYKVSMW